MIKKDKRAGENLQRKGAEKASFFVNRRNIYWRQRNKWFSVGYIKVMAKFTSKKNQFPSKFLHKKNFSKYILW